MFFSVYTLGCKLNQLETEAITDSFSRKGFTFTSWDNSESAIRVINTCTVTSIAEQKARRIIRKALREDLQACVVVTGCYVQMEMEALSSLVGEKTNRLFLVPGDKKDRLLDLPDYLAGKGALDEGTLPNGTSTELPKLIASWFQMEQQDFTDSTFRFKPEMFFAHSRGFLKIQDGCDNCCSYCRVGLARGKSRSLELSELLSELRALKERGFAEVVLTGVNISQYNDSGMRLPLLLENILKGTEVIRIRLSSLEPEVLNEDFFKIIENKRIRPHFHLSVQSGSPKILSKMGRYYSPEDIEQAAARFRKASNDPFLACDIIVGFPGETEQDFQSTLMLCERINFAWIHTFPFSPRPGTAAFSFPDKVSERDAKRRVVLLTELAHKGRRDYIERWMGREVEAVIESARKKKLPKNSVQGLSENYLKLKINYGNKSAPHPGALIHCRITGIAPEPFDALACKY